MYVLNIERDELVFLKDREGRKVPGSEEDDSQHTSKESCPVSTQPSEEHKDIITELNIMEGMLVSHLGKWATTT